MEKIKDGKKIVYKCGKRFENKKKNKKKGAAVSVPMPEEVNDV